MNTLSYQKISQLLQQWYQHEKRELPWRDAALQGCAYRVWLSEIILQQTRVQQGLEYYMRFVDRFPTVEELAAAQEDEVLLLWQGLGYYSRARNLHKAAKMIVENGWTPFPQQFDQVISLPGVGEYTAGAIMSFAYDAPYPAADGNVYRVLSRLFDCDEPFDTTQGKKMFRQMAWELLDRSQPRMHNSATMEFGALYCTPTSPDCGHCPVSAYCMAHQHGTAELLPVRKPRPAIRDRYLMYTVYVTPDNHTLIRQRTAKDIWQHLYEFPVQEFLSKEDMENGLHEEHPDGRLFRFTHVLSHQRLHALFVITLVDMLPAQDGCFPIRWEQLQDYALSRLTLRYLEAVQP